MLLSAPLTLHRCVACPGTYNGQWCIDLEPIETQAMDDRDTHDSPLPRPRFSLRALLLAVTAAAVFFGVVIWLSPLAIAAVVLAGLVFAAHVFGNAIGTQLRDRAPRRQFDSQASIRPSPLHAPAPTTRLGERWALGWAMIVPTAAGVFLGGLGGCVLMQYAYQIGFDMNVLLVAGIAFGSLGGFAAFALASFSQVLAVAFLEALRQK